jgi:hypothetical protein
MNGVLKSELPVEIALLLKGKKLRIDEIPEMIDGED